MISMKLLFHLDLFYVGTHILWYVFYNCMSIKTFKEQNLLFIVRSSIDLLRTQMIGGYEMHLKMDILIHASCAFVETPMLSIHGR